MYEPAEQQRAGIVNQRRILISKRSVENLQRKKTSEWLHSFDLRVNNILNQLEDVHNMHSMKITSQSVNDANYVGYGQYIQ